MTIEIVGFPIKHGDFQYLCKRLPEGIYPLDYPSIMHSQTFLTTIEHYSPLLTTIKHYQGFQLLPGLVGHEPSASPAILTNHRTRKPAEPPGSGLKACR